MKHQPRERRRKNPVTRWLFRILCGLLACAVAAVLVFRWVPVRHTPLMLRRSLTFRADSTWCTQQIWIPVEQVSPDLIKAVILAEDRYFFQHHGFDFDEMRDMWELHRKEGAPLKGCSTISQQTAKNVFTFGTHTWSRKVLETGWTLLIEALWGKERILEVYLNVAEWGRGIYGIEAASRCWYGVPASALGPDEAVSLATNLRAPLRLSPLDASDPQREALKQKLKTRMETKELPDWIDWD